MRLVSTPSFRVFTFLTGSHCKLRPNTEGLLNASVVQVMHEAGKAINDTFKLNNAGASFTIPSHSCSTGVVVLQVAASEGKSEEFDFIVTMEDLRYGQRIGNYSIEYRLVGSDKWAMLVPPVVAGPPPPPVTAEQPHRVTDRPDGHGTLPSLSANTP
jgi:hypothetical protein